MFAELGFFVLSSSRENNFGNSNLKKITRSVVTTLQCSLLLASNREVHNILSFDRKFVSFRSVFLKLLALGVPKVLFCFC